MDSIGRYARGKNIGIPLLFSMLYSWWGIMIPGSVWEYTSLEKWRASFSHSLSLSLRPPKSDSDTQSIRQMIMIFRQCRDEWVCDEYFIYFNGLRKPRTVSGSAEAKHGLSLQTSSFENKVWMTGGADEAAPYLAGTDVGSSAAPVYCEWQ